PSPQLETVLRDRHAAVVSRPAAGHAADVDVRGRLLRARLAAAGDHRREEGAFGGVDVTGRLAAHRAGAVSEVPVVGLETLGGIRAVVRGRLRDVALQGNRRADDRPGWRDLDDAGGELVGEGPSRLAGSGRRAPGP